MLLNPLSLSTFVLFTSFFDGIHPTFIHVPPYILSDFSINATFCPFPARNPARVFPPFPNPIITASYFFILVLLI